MVTLSLQYSTQWDSLAHVGAEFDADGDGVEEAVYYNGYRAGTDLVGPRHDAAGDGGSHRCFAHHLGLEHMAYHGVQGRGVLVDLAHHLGDEWRAVDRATLEEIMAEDDVVVEPGDMLLLHTGFATRILEYEREPDPKKIFTLCSYLDARDESLLEWIADSQISALVADNYAVEGLLGQGPRPEPALVPPDPQPLPVQAGRPAGGDVVSARVGGLAARARPQPVPAYRPAAADARDRGFTRHPDRHRLTPARPAAGTACVSRLRRWTLAISLKSFGRPPELRRYLRGFPGMLVPKK